MAIAFPAQVFNIKKSNSFILLILEINVEFFLKKLFDKKN